MMQASLDNDPIFIKLAEQTITSESEKKMKKKTMLPTLM
jgi:hypothetical protein